MALSEKQSDEYTSMKDSNLSAEASSKTVGCLFSGMGGFATGFVEEGFQIGWASDLDSSASKTFQHTYPNVPFIEGDVRDLSVHEHNLTKVDVLAAGFPCQSFSIAGNKKGFNDSRGALFFEILRILAEFRLEEQPSILVFENVPNLLHGNNGNWFDEIRRAIRKAGYWFRADSCVVLNVKDVTMLPQDRRRLFMFAASRSHFSHNPFPSILSKIGHSSKSLELRSLLNLIEQGVEDSYLSPQNRYYKMIMKAMELGQSELNLYQLRRSYVREKRNGLCPTLTANMGGGGHNVPFLRDAWGIRRLSVDEVAKLQGFTSTTNLFPDIPTKDRYRLLGNAVCVKLANIVGSICLHVLQGSGSYE